MDTLVMNELRELGKLELSLETSAEELQGIKNILERAGLIVRVENLTLSILVKERS